MNSKIWVLPFLLLLLVSCASSKKIVYLQDSGKVSDSTATELARYETTIQPDDMLLITVTAEEPELASPYNLIFINSAVSQARVTSSDDLYTYLVSQDGEIDFPVIGKINLKGLTRVQAENKIRDLVERQIKNPGVVLKILNFKVSVIGEVSRPGPIRVPGDRYTILEALSAAGDLTIYGKRKEIVVVREKDGVRTIDEVDITDTAILTSPYYYLSHNDVVYVKPNKTRVNSSVIGPNIGVGFSVISLLITIFTLSTR